LLAHHYYQFNHFVFLAHLSSFVQVWSEGLRYCKQPKESNGSLLEKFQSHQHNLGVAARSGTELPAISQTIFRIFEQCQVVSF